MGNQLAAPSKPGVEHAGELLNTVVKETMGGGRLLKTLLCVHDNGGLVVVKVFYKRRDTTSLAPYKQQLEAVRCALLGLSCPHVWPMQAWWETPNAAFMMRQHFFANLYDRLSTRPFLTGLEKRWITFQLLHAASQAHAHGVCHGDIKAENVMVTSWNWVLLTDFATYKPTYLPADNPADFSYYFDTGGRRRCYLAPERFFEGSPAAINTAAPLQPDMDVFALGCVIAELWLGEDRAFFDLSRLLAYRRGEHDPAPALAGVEPDIAELVMHMIQRAPGDRWSADHYLTSWPRQLFPPHFAAVLHPFFSSLLELDPDARLAAVAAHYDTLAAAVAGGGSSSGAALAWAPSVQQVTSTPSQLSSSTAPAPPAAIQQQQQPGARPPPPQPPPAAVVSDARGAAIAGVVPGAAGAASDALLAEVDSLLADVSSVQRRLTPGAGAGGGLLLPAAEDDGICIDDPARQEEAGGSSSGGGSSAARPPASAGLQLASPAAAGAPVSSSRQQPQTAAPVPEDAWFEYQVRDAAQRWVPHTPPGSSSSKESISLPAHGGWAWQGPWQLAAAGGGLDTSSEGGWLYAAELQSGKRPLQDSSWLPVASAGSRLRCRKWVRRRVRAGQEMANAAVAAGAAHHGQDQGMVLLAVLLCTLLRGTKLVESKRAAMLLLRRTALQCDDDVRLQTVVPYLLTQLSDPHAAVRTLALGSVVAVMSSLSQLPPADAKVYHDYLLPSLSLLPNDPEESVRVAYAQAIAHLAAAAHEHLLTMQYGASSTHQAADDGPGSATAAAAAVHQGGSGSGAAAGGEGGQAQQQQQQQQHPVVRYDAEMAAVRGSVERVVLELVTGVRSSPDIKRGLLSHAHQLGLFFGRREIIDQLLPLLITCLNDQVEWRLRGRFFGAIAAVGPHTGHLDAFLLPCLEQALQDSEPAVVCDAVRCLADVCAHLPKRSLLKAARQVSPLLRHRAPAVRHSAVAFIAAVARALPPADVYTQLAVMVAGQLQQQPLLLSDEEHLAACLHPCGAAADGSATQQQQQQQPRSQHTLQHSATAYSSSGHTQQQQQQQLRLQDLAAALGARDRRATIGDSRPLGVLGGGREHGTFGTLLTRPGDAAVLQHSLSERPSSRAGGHTPVSLAPWSHTSLVPGVNVDGSSLLLRPTAPVYCLDLDPAAMGGVGAPAPAAAAPADGLGAAAGVAPDVSGRGDRPAAAAAAGMPGIGSRCGYRADGFGPPGAAAATTTQPAAAAASSSSGASAGAQTTAAGAAPRRFWPDAAAGAAGAASHTSSSRSGGMLTGFNTQLAVGPGGLVIGPSGAASGVGLRPRPKSSHTAAVESISRRQAVLQEHYNSLAEALARDPSSVEAGDRQQMDRLAATLHRLSMQPGHDVRCPAALLTYKMAAITSRAGPTGTAPGTGGPGDASSTLPAVHDAVNAAITTGIGQHLPGSGGGESCGPSWRPRGVLASHLHEHRAAVNCLAASNNGALLISGSDDETVKVWDVRRLERDVSFSSRLTYAGQSGRITSVCPVLDGASVASASASGSLHVWRVEYTTKPGGWAPDKYRGITAVRQVSPGEGAILHVLPWANHSALLLYATQRGGVHCCDLRCARDAWHVPPAPSLGLVQQLVADPSGQHWLVQGSSRGWVCLWDVRFLLCVNSWQHPQRCGIQAMAAAVAAPPRLGLAQDSLPRPGVPLLYIAAGRQEVGLWDVLDGQCHQVLRVLNSDESLLSHAEPPAALLPPASSAASPHSRPTSQSGAAAPAGQQAGADVSSLASELNAHMAIDQINTPQARLEGVTALLPLGNGALLTGGADRCVRFWEPSWPERSYIVAGPVWPDNTAIMDPNTNKLQVPGHVYRYHKLQYNGVPVVEERSIGEGPRLVTPDSSPDLGSKLRMHDLAHVDGITQLISVDGSSRLLASASRDGCVKVWK